MRSHNGMRPQDIAVLLKIVVFSSSGKAWLNKDLANELYLSNSEISESLHRSSLARLVDYEKKKVQRQSFREFLIYGFRFVFPQHPGAIVNGMPTAHSHPYMREKFISNTVYAWPDLDGLERGQAIEPLYPGQVKAIKRDERLYLLLALVDVLRVGRVREVHEAVAKLSKEILQ